MLKAPGVGVRTRDPIDDRALGRRAEEDTSTVLELDEVNDAAVRAAEVAGIDALDGAGGEGLLDREGSALLLGRQPHPLKGYECLRRRQVMHRQVGKEVGRDDFREGTPTPAVGRPAWVAIGVPVTLPPKE